MGAQLKVWHEKPISNAHGIIDTDLADKLKFAFSPFRAIMEKSKRK